MIHDGRFKIEEEDDVSVMRVAAVDDGASSVSGGM